MATIQNSRSSVQSFQLKLLHVDFSDSLNKKVICSLQQWLISIIILILIYYRCMTLNNYNQMTVETYMMF